MLLWAAAAALALRYGVHGWPGGSGASPGALALLFVVPLLAFALMAAGGLYRLDELFSGHREYAGVVRSCTYAAFAALALSFLLDAGLSRGALVLDWVYSCLLVGGARFGFRRLVFRLRRSGRLQRMVLLAGTDEHAVTIARQLSHGNTGWRVLGFLDDYQPVGVEVVDGLRVVGDPRRAAELADTLGASDLIVVPHAVSWESQRDLLELAASTDEPAVRLAPGLYHLLAAGARPLDANYVPLLTLERLRITGLDAALKTLLDYGAALATLPFLGALMALLWPAARLTGGPVLVSQRAHGLRGATFELRTVARPAGQQPDGGAASWAWRLRDGIAMGRLGKLPNVLNVLAGRMSLVGPRALPDDERLLQEPWARTLLLVRPGLTGPRVGERVEWSLEEQGLHDVAYVREYSLWVDLRLLVASLMRALRREESVPLSYHSPALDDVAPARIAAK
ncbi:MAG: sugar transferase [Dehalococcoidia bacterium]